MTEGNATLFGGSGSPQSPPHLVLEFTKMSGAGNDFIVIDNRFFAFSESELSALAKGLCPRRTSVGSDGILALETRGLSDGEHFRMRYFNADGSLGSMCGNGARCLVKFAYDAGLFPDGSCSFLTDAGLYRASVLATGDVRLFVPPPSSHLQTTVPIPNVEPADMAHYIWTGTEHAVCFVDDVGGFPVGEVGPVLRRKQEFGPNGANINFVEVADEKGDLSVRTYEKGVENETLAMCAGALLMYLFLRILGGN